MSSYKINDETGTLENTVNTDQNRRLKIQDVGPERVHPRIINKSNFYPSG